MWEHYAFVGLQFINLKVLNNSWKGWSFIIVFFKKFFKNPRPISYLEKKKVGSGYAIRPISFLYIYRISLKVFGEISGPLIIFFFRTQRTLYSKFKKAHPNLHLFKHPYPAQNSQRLLFPFFFFFLFSLSLCILRNNKKGGSFYTCGDHNWVHWCGCGCGCGCGRGAEAPKRSC